MVTWWLELCLLSWLGSKFFPNGNLGGASQCPTPPHATFGLLGFPSPYAFRKQHLKESHGRLLERGN